MHPLAQAAVDIHHAALSSLPQPLRLLPTGQHSQLPRGATVFHLDLHYPQRLAHDGLLSRPGADDDADDYIDRTMGPPRLGISPGSIREAAWDDLTALLTITEPSRRRRELWGRQSKKNLAAVDKTEGARLLDP
jgi:hypothetical protein